MLSNQKKLVIGLATGILLLGQVMVQAEDGSSSTAGTVSQSSRSLVVEEEVSPASEQELPSSSATQVQKSSSQEAFSESGTVTEVTSSSSSPVTESSSSSSRSVKKDAGVNLEKILAKDYRSLSGTWKNAQGTTLFVTKDGLIYTKGANGGYLSLDGIDKTKSAFGSAIFLKSQPDQQKAGHLYLVPAGKAFVNPTSAEFKDKTQQNQDRFSLGEVYEMGREALVFYRVSTELEVEPASASESETSSPTETETSSTVSESSSNHQTEPSVSKSSQETNLSSASSSLAASVQTSSSSSSTEKVEKQEVETSDLADQGLGLDSLPRTKTVTRRILPSTGEKLSLLLPILGVISFIAVAIIKKKRDK